MLSRSGLFKLSHQKSYLRGLPKILELVYFKLGGTVRYQYLIVNTDKPHSHLAILCGVKQCHSNYVADYMPRLNPLLVRDKTNRESSTVHRLRVNRLESLTM